MNRQDNNRSPVRSIIAVLGVSLALASAGCPPKEQPASSATPAQPTAAKQAEPAPAAQPSKPAPPPTDTPPAQPTPAKTPAPAPTPPPTPQPVDQAKFREALRQAIEACNDVPFETTDSPDWNESIRVRSQVWREDQFGDMPCVLGYPRGRQVLVAVAEKLSDEYLHEWLRLSLDIAEDREKLALRRGVATKDPVRRWLYPPRGIAEAAYNLARDPVQKERARQVWEALETVRFEAMTAKRRERLAALEKAEKERALNTSEKLDLAILRQTQEERNTLPVWQADGEEGPTPQQQPLKQPIH